MSSPIVEHIGEWFIKPKYQIEESLKEPIIYLAPWDLAMLSVHYLQQGLLFSKPIMEDQYYNIEPLLDKLKDSLSIALVHFYPLAGQFVTTNTPNCYSVYIDCNCGPGAKFTYATLKSTISDIVSPPDVPSVVDSLFDHDRAVNHEGHSTSLLTIQVTELIDGVFLGCSMNHSAADGTSLWRFISAWAEIFNSKENSFTISHPPIHKHWFPKGCGPIVGLPFTHKDQFVSRYEAPEMRVRFFHFTTSSLAKIKAKAILESNISTISSLQALAALVWRCVTRLRCLPAHQITSCRMAMNNRSRMNPPLPESYFGNSIQTVRGMTTAGELMEHDLGWAASLLNQAVATHTDKAINEWLEVWLKSPLIYQLGKFFDPCSVMFGNSPRFEMYDHEFGLGKAVAIRSGYGNKFDGKVSLFQGCEGGGSMDLEVSLLPHYMAALESDEEFINAISSPN